MRPRSPNVGGLKPARESFKILLSGRVSSKGGIQMTKVPLKRVRFAATALLVSPLTLLGQAAVEYALRSGQSIPVDSATIAGCRVDSALFTCLGHAYPRTALLVAAAIFLVFVRWLTGVTGYRAR